MKHATDINDVRGKIQFIFMKCNKLRCLIVYHWFSPSSKLVDRAIYFADVFSFFIIIFYFLMIDFLETVSQNLIDRF